MVSRRKTYTREFKIETVKLITDGVGHVPDIARDMGRGRVIPPIMLR